MNGALRIGRQLALLTRRWLGILVLQVLCGLLPTSAVHAEDIAPIVLTADTPSHSLDGHMAFLKDETGLLGIDDVVRHRDFKRVTSRQPGLATGTLWYRFTVRRPADVPPDWILAFGEPDIDDIRVYVPTQAGGFTESGLGRRIPSSQLSLAAKRHVAMLSLPEAAPITIYIRLSSLHKIRFEEVALWRPGALMFEESRQSALEGVQTGVMAVILVVYALSGLWLRDATMMVYATFVGTNLSRHITHSGIVALLFTRSGGDVNYLLGGIGLFGGIAAFILMWDKVLDLKGNFPVIHRVYRLTGLVVVLPILFVKSTFFSFFVLPAQMIMFSASIGSVILAFVLVRRNKTDILLKFYLFAFLPIVLAWGVEISALVSPVVPIDLGRTMDRLATMAHMAILSVALAYRFGLMLRQREDMRRLATIDSLTGIANRRHFMDVGTRELTRSRRYGSSTSVLILDIDDFKRINDTWGHATGDRVIQSVAHLMATTFRQQDAIGRLGGEEFVALLPETDLAETLVIAERLRIAVESLASVSEAGQAIRVTVSVGIATLEDGDSSIEDVLRRADKALYIAKDSGRNRVAADGEMTSERKSSA